MPGAQEALDRLRSLGVPVGVVTNQSGIGHGLLSWHDVDQVNARVEELLGPFDVWQVCPHTESNGCSCRKPSPRMLLAASTALGTDPSEVVFVGDIGADMAAATAAGARGVLVPTPVTLKPEVDAAETVCASLAEAVDLILTPSHHSTSRAQTSSELWETTLSAHSSINPPSSPGPLGAPSPPSAPVAPVPGIPGPPVPPPFPSTPVSPAFPVSPGSPDYPGTPISPPFPDSPTEPEYPGTPDSPGDPGSPISPVTASSAVSPADALGGGR